MHMSVSLSQSQRLEEFPITRTKGFLAHAAISPFSRRVCEAIQSYCQCNADSGQWEFLYGAIEHQTREYAASLLGSRNDEIAFIPSTSVGLNIIAGGLTWKTGDNIIVAEGDFPANIYPWLNLRRQGVKIRYVRWRPDGAIYPEDIEKLADGNTRLVSLSSANFVTGFRPDIKVMGKLLRRKGILFCVDAIQSLGAFPFDADCCDFAVASAHKWLMGPIGIGLLYINTEMFERVHPLLPGWKSVKENKNYLDYKLVFPDSAERYESGSPNGLGLVGLHAALEILIETGIENIAFRLAGLRRILIERLAEMGCAVISTSGREGSGIVSFTDNAIDMGIMKKLLDDAGFVVSLRESFDGCKYIRISPHFYNTEEEIDALLEMVNTFRKSMI